MQTQQLIMIQMIIYEFLIICPLCSALCVQIFKFSLKLEHSAKSHALNFYIVQLHYLEHISLHQVIH